MTGVTEKLFMCQMFMCLSGPKIFFMLLQIYGLFLPDLPCSASICVTLYLFHALVVLLSVCCDIP